MDNTPSAPKPISLHLLKEMTNNFSMERKLGGGSYGDVYLGVPKNGEKIAVKVLKDGQDLDDKQYEKEYCNLASLDHKNIVRLVGYCHETVKEFTQHEGRTILFEKSKKMLCFEYMHNKGLDKFISDESNGHNWQTCYVIIKGICEGLEYIHEKLESPMYHLDLKPANILLDEKMTPKIADFGLSRLFLAEKTKVTKSDIGTPGYRPPEYIDTGVISIKFDIFSLGVVIIEIMAGRDGYFRSADMPPHQFVQLVHTEWMNRLKVTSMSTYSIQVKRCIKIALSCVQKNPNNRPSIGVIVNNVNQNTILDELRNGSESLIDEDHQLCPCLINETEMLDILKTKLISYPLRLTDNRGRMHEATITTVGDSAGGTSTFQPVRPGIKIIDCTEGLGDVIGIDVHSKEPWILVGHRGVKVSIWNHQNQTRVMAFHSISETCKFIEPVQCFVVGDSVGYIHVYSYVKVDKLQKFRAHEEGVRSLAVHPSEPFVLSASHDKLIKLWNWEAGWQCIRTFEGHSSSVYQVKFNPQTAGNTFASISADWTTKIWNIHSPTPVASFNGMYVNLDYFTPTGDRQYLVSGSYYGNARIWDLLTNTSIMKIKGFQRDDHNIAVFESLPCRPILLTVSHDHTVAFCDSNTHRYENRVQFNMGQVLDFAYINAIKSLAIAYRRGIAIMEIN